MLLTYKHNLPWFKDVDFSGLCLVCGVVIHRRTKCHIHAMLTGQPFFRPGAPFTAGTGSKALSCCEILSWQLGVLAAYKTVQYYSLIDSSFLLEIPQGLFFFCSLFCRMKCTIFTFFSLGFPPHTHWWCERACNPYISLQNRVLLLPKQEPYHRTPSAGCARCAGSVPSSGAEVVLLW